MLPAAPRWYRALQPTSPAIANWARVEFGKISFLSREWFLLKISQLGVMSLRSITPASFAFLGYWLVQRLRALRLPRDDASSLYVLILECTNNCAFLGAQNSFPKRRLTFFFLYIFVI